MKETVATVTIDEAGGASADDAFASPFDSPFSKLDDLPVPSLRDEDGRGTRTGGCRCRLTPCMPAADHHDVAV